MGRGKHSSSNDDYSFNSKFEKEINYEEEISRKKILIIVAIILVIIMTFFAVYKIFFDKKEPEPIVQEGTIISEPKMEESIAGYKVLGKILIKDLNVEQYILNSAEENALENGVGKLYGETLNNYGNFCIAGHNKEGIFEKLAELEIGDEFVIIDRDLEETTYEVKQIYSVEPDDLKCLIQDENKIEITLITCENGATTRLIVKAEEKANNVTNENVENTVSDSKENV